MGLPPSSNNICSLYYDILTQAAVTRYSDVIETNLETQSWNL